MQSREQAKPPAGTLRRTCGGFLLNLGCYLNGGNFFRQLFEGRVFGVFDFQAVGQFVQGFQAHGFKLCRVQVPGYGAPFVCARNFRLHIDCGFVGHGVQEFGHLFAQASRQGKAAKQHILHNAGNFSCSDAISLASLNEAQTIEKIRSYVKNHIPVACHAVGSGNRQHWFVAYELTGESGGTWATAGIKVLDPYNSNSGSTEGRRVTILEAMQTSHVTLGVDRIRIPN